jgi:hypothetical protein
MAVMLNPTASVTDSITVSSTGGPYTITSDTGITVPWTGTGSNTITMDSSWNRPASSKLRLDGPEADIEINGESLTDMLRNIQQRLNILKPNPELESEWEELRVLGDQYRALEKHIMEKQATWDRLKAMPPPEIL